ACLDGPPSAAALGRLAILGHVHRLSGLEARKIGCRWRDGATAALGNWPFGMRPHLVQCRLVRPGQRIRAAAQLAHALRNIADRPRALISAALLFHGGLPRE